MPLPSLVTRFRAERGRGGCRLSVSGQQEPGEHTRPLAAASGGERTGPRGLAASPTRAGGGNSSLLLISRVPLWSPSLSVPSGGLIWAAAVCPALVGAQRCFRVGENRPAEAEETCLRGDASSLGAALPRSRVTRTQLWPWDLGVGASHRRAS